MIEPLKSVNQDDINRMEALWKQYERDVIWRGDAFEDEHPEVTPLTRMEQIYAWEDWACGRLARP